MNKIGELFNSEVNVINVGIDFISNDIKKQGAVATQLDWTPPARGNLELLALLDSLNSEEKQAKIEAANKEAVERIIKSQPVLIGYDQAINCVPGMTKTTILHAGPPITWEKMSGPMKGAVTGAIVFEGLAADLVEAEEVNNYLKSCDLALTIKRLSIA